MKEPAAAIKHHYDLLKGRTIRDIIWTEDKATGDLFPTLVLNWTDKERGTGKVPLVVVTTDEQGKGFLSHNLGREEAQSERL